MQHISTNLLNIFRAMEVFGTIKYNYRIKLRGSANMSQILSSAKPLSLSTPSNIRVGGFARQAQVSHVLHILMMHLRDSKNSFPDPEEAGQIARTLTAFSMLLPEETPQPWPMYCGALGMCFRFVPLLSISRLSNIMQCTNDTPRITTKNFSMRRVSF